MKYKIFILFIGVCFITCQQAVTEQNAETATSEVEANALDAKDNQKDNSKEANKPPRFVLNNFQGEMEAPRSTISLNMDGKIIEVIEAVGCDRIKPSDYAQFEIPEEAVDACGGWWAGMGEYFYIVKNQESDYYMVMKATVEEEQESPGYHYQSVMNIVHKFK